MWQKSNETDFIFTKVFYFYFFSNINVIPFKVVPFGGYKPMETLFPVFGSSAGSLQPVGSSAYPLYSFGCFLKSRNDVLWGQFKFRNKDDLPSVKKKKSALIWSWIRSFELSLVEKSLQRASPYFPLGLRIVFKN